LSESPEFAAVKNYTWCGRQSGSTHLVSLQYFFWQCVALLVVGDGVGRYLPLQVREGCNFRSS